MGPHLRWIVSEDSRGPQQIQRLSCCEKTQRICILLSTLLRFYLFIESRDRFIMKGDKGPILSIKCKGLVRSNELVLI